MSTSEFPDPAERVLAGADARGIPPQARGYDRHPGRIGHTTRESQRAWPRERRAPEGAPNIVLMLLDDMGYSDIGPFGGEIPTPNLDRIAAEGVRLTNYHTTPVCSPARAAMLTGLNPHRAGFGSVANSDPGFPNLRLEIDEDVLTLPEILREEGWATYAVGKWHLTRDALMNDAAPKDSWPLQRGFERYYGSLEGLNSFFHPNRIIRDNSAVDRDEQPDTSQGGYYVTDDYTDQAISMIWSLRANDADKPFLLYFAHTAMHGPLAAKPVDLERQRGRYAAGWDRMREDRLARQKEMGIFPAGLELPDRTAAPGFEVPAWDELDAETQQRYARLMEVYAAMVDNVDQNLGRLLDTLEETGDLDNTIIVFTSDNGGTMEGGPEGTRSYFSRFVHLAGLPADWEADVERDVDLIGGPQTMAHYPRGWGMVSNTPFRFYKGQTFAGGVRVPFLMSWPRGLARGSDDAGIRPQFQYVTDVLPTLLELAGVSHPGIRRNLPAQEIDGISFASVVREDGPATRTEQYAEFGGNRGYYRDGWKLVSLGGPGIRFRVEEWELYDVANDPNELHDVSAEHPDLVLELAEAWEDAAWRNTVFPLQHGFGLDAIRRPAEDLLSEPVELRPGTPKLERYRSRALVELRSFEVDVELHHEPGEDGVLLAHGDQGGGYVLYLEGGRLRFAYNEYGRLHEVDAGELPAGERRLGLHFRWLPEFRWEITLTSAAPGEVPDPVAGLGSVRMLVGMAPFSGIDVGVNRGGPVSWPLFERHGAFRYRGALHVVRYRPGERADFDPALLQEAEREAALWYD